MRSSVSGARGNHAPDELEQPHHEPGVGFETLRRPQKHRPVQHGKIGIRKLRRTGRENCENSELRLDSKRSSRRLASRAISAHGAIILPHERFRRRRAAQRRDFVLALEAELVVVAPAEIMQETTDLEQHRNAARQIVIARPQLRQPAQHLQIAQSARRVFDVRFQMINRVLKARVPFMRQLHDIAAQIGPRIADLPEQRFVARQQPPVEQADRKFGIRGVDLIAFRGVWTDWLMRSPSSQRSRRNMDSGSLIASCVFSSGVRISRSISE